MNGWASWIDVGQRPAGPSAPADRGHHHRPLNTRNATHAPSVWQSALAMTLRRTSPACGGATRIFSVTSGSLAAHATAARHSIGFPSNSDDMVRVWVWLIWLTRCCLCGGSIGIRVCMVG